MIVLHLKVCFSQGRGQSLFCPPDWESNDLMTMVEQDHHTLQEHKVT